jgi:hypothetical protein
MNRRKLIKVVAALAAVAAASLYYFVLAPLLIGPERVAAAFGDDLRAALGVAVRYEDARFTVWPRPAVRLRGASFTNAAGKELVRADEVRVGLSYPGFIILKPAVAALTFERPRADLAAGDLGFGGAGGAPAFRATVVVNDGFLKYAAGKKTGFVDGWRGKVRCRAEWGVELEIRGKMSAERLNFAGADDEGGGISVAAEGKIIYRPEPPGGRVTFDKLDLLFDKARLTAAGEIQTGPGEKDVDISLTGKDMAVSHVLPALAPRFEDVELEGTLDLNVRVKGEWGDGRKPDVRGELTLKKGALTPERGEGVSQVSAVVRFEGDKYVVENLRGQTERGGFKGFGKVSPEENWPYEFEIEGAVPLGAAAVVFGFPEGYRLVGPTQANLDLSGELGAPGRTSLDGSVELLGCQVRLKPFATPFREIKGTVYFEGYRAKTGKLKAELAGGALEIGGSWQGFDTPRLDFVVSGSDLDLDAALPERGKKGKEVEGAAADVGLPGKDITAKGSIRLKGCKLLGVRATKVDTDFEYGAGILNLQKLNFDAYDGDVRAEATVFPGARPKYTFSAAVRDARVGTYLTENKYLENVLTGKFSADVVFTAEGTRADDVKKTVGGKGSLELSGGRVAGLPLLVELKKWSRIDYFEPLQISKLWIMADARDGVIRSADFRLENPDMTAEAAGEVDLEKTLNVVVKTTFRKKAADAVAREGKALALVREKNGEAHFNFIVTGEAAKPAFQLDAASMLGAAGEAGPAETGATAEIGELF